MNPVHLGQYLVNQFGHVPGGVTPLKLQKLVYYVKAWSLVDGAPLVDGTFVRWTHGPVNVPLYLHFKDHGRAPLQPVALGPEHTPQGAARDFVDFVGHSYAHFPAVALSKMTHDEAPWKETPPKRIIADALIRDFYAGQPFAANLPFDPTGKPYVAVQSDMDRAFTLDLRGADARRAATYASYAAYLEHLERAGLLTESDWLNRLLA
jgi:uncharacterized phage-associated protein